MFAVFVFLLFLFFKTQSQAIVETSNGPVKGFISQNSTIFLGIPFAAPPLGELRWKPPQLPKKWTNILNANKFAPACIQFPDARHNVTIVSEDCLYLNVYTPTSPPPSNGFPVMVYIYGGGFYKGTGNFYQPFNFISQEIVVVNFNYRLGVFGFLALPQFMYENPELETTGNYGIQDQRAVLEWVQSNIRNFGGNPSNVTIFGESAGAVSVLHHLASPLSANLFHGGIIQSGGEDWLDIDTAFVNGQNIVKGTNCSGNFSEIRDCLRAISSDDLFSMTNALKWGPVIDGYELTADPMTLFYTQKFNEVPIIIGTNLNEMSLFLCPIYSKNFTDSDFMNWITNKFESDSDEIYDLYNPSNYSNALQAFIDLASDYYFKCPSRKFARAFAEASLPVYLYSFNHIPGFSGGCYGVAHSFDLPFVFPILIEYIHYQFKEGEAQLASFMGENWSLFAKSLQPNWEWPIFTYESDANIIFDLNISTQNGYRKKYCDFWDSI